MRTRLSRIEPRTVAVVHPDCAASVFWELDPAVAGKVIADGSARFEKEAWLATVLLDGGCGFNLVAATGASERVIASVLHCSPAQAPGAAQLPTAPVSSDSHLLTSLHIDSALAGCGLESVLIDAVVAELMNHNVHAVEAIAYRRDYVGDLSTQTTRLLAIADRAAEHGIMGLDLLESAGFKVIQDHPLFPRVRIELPPPHALLTAEAVEQLLSRAVV
ncbi:hypothetical protein [Corynebacterium vitaeruminis]|uniref:hypothetical protein n=1 Tax=Corynebacterium vitaeruminis TaxID=38305 RepID=UPI000555C9FB|nr:hypothetical protein [Corynebacterium vitaeruminis]